MAFMAPPVKDERDALAAYLHQQQDAFRAVIFGLTDEQARSTPVPSSLSVGTLVKHAASVQEGWLQQALHAPDPVPEPGEAAYAEYERGFTWTEEDSVESVLAGLDDVSRRVLEAVRTVDLDLPVPVPPAPWNPRDVEAWSVRWVWLHLVEELARHAGHADIIREAVDGATMYELIAARDGLEETPWLKPWRPPAARAAD
jgi:hypothetical protein